MHDPAVDNPHPVSVGGGRADSTSLTLLERVKRDDSDAWNRLIDLYSPLIRHWCRRWGVDPVEVDDVLQDVFQAVASGLTEFRRDRQGDSFRGWLRGVTRHKVASLFRRRATRGQGGTDFYQRSLNVPDPHSETDQDESQALGTLYQHAIQLVRAEFEDRTWQAFWRAAVDGQSPPDIGRDLGVSAAAVRQAKSRVLRRLKDVLGEAPQPATTSPPA